MKRIFIIINCLIITFITTLCLKEKTNYIISLVDIGANVHNMKEIYISQFSTNIRYVPLESNIDHLLLWTYNNLSDFSEKYILYSDGKICLLYDNAGRFIRPIGKQGRGPGEYTGIGSVFLMNEEIYVHDFFTNALIEYKLDGTFQKRYKSGYTANDKYRLEDAIIINDTLILGNIENTTGQEEYKALIIDKQGKIIHYYKNYIFFKLEPGFNRAKSPGDAIFYKFENKIYFKEFYNDTLFQIDEQYRLIPIYVFDFGKYKVPVSERGKPWSQKALSSQINLNNVYQTKNFVFLDCGFNKYFPAKRLTPKIIRIPGLKDFTQWYNTGAVLGVYDKKTGDLVFSEPTSTDNHLFTSGLYNDIDAGPRFIPDKMINDSTMVMKIRFDFLVEHIESNDFKDNILKYPDRKERLNNFVDSLRTAGFDNPVFMFVTFNNEIIAPKSQLIKKKKNKKM